MAEEAAPVLVPADWPAPAAPEARRLAGVAALALAASLGLHVAGVAVVALVHPAAEPPPVERAVTVDILTAAEFAAMTAPRPPAADRRTAMLPPAAEAPPRAADAMVRPDAMLSARALSDPRSADTRAVLRTLGGADRMVQLCGIEAMEQVHAWRESLAPDRVVAYASAEVAVAGDAVSADGAALRSGHAWYALRFDCRLAPDHETVTAFAFRLGAPIPPEEWEARNLPTDFGDDDTGAD